MRPAALARPALEAARRALADLDEDQVPPPLRKLAASSARSLPPPLASTLRKALDDGEWLRELALEHLAGGGEDGDLAHRWSREFLRRDPGWEERSAALSREAEGRAEDVEARSVEVENRRLRGRVERLERLLAKARARSSRAGGGPDPGLVERLQDSNRAVRAAADRLREELAEALGELDELRDELDGADRRIAELKRRLAGRSRAEAAGTGETGAADRAFGVGDPVRLARFLDDLQRSLERAPQRPVDERSPVPLSVPPGIRPDGAGSIDWLLGLEEPSTVLVDGYNVAFELAPAPDSAVRRRVENLAARMARRADGPMSVIVFWDSRLESTLPARGRGGGIEVRYVPSADDAIVAVAAEAVNPVVVSGDREVRERAARHGAVGLWSAAAVAWHRAR
jgi:hypothetical protein